MLKDVIDRLLRSPNNEHEPITNFINNEFVKANDLIPSVNPATGHTWIQIPNSGKEDVDRAVAAANQAFQAWSVTSAQYRSNLLLKLADIIEQNSDGLAVLESRDQGKPVKLARMIDIPRCVHNFRFFATAILHHISPSTIMDQPVRAVNYVRNDPVGVAGLISPWNLPLYLLSFKLAPALATGNTVVCKPSEMTSVTAWVLMHAFKEAGFPAGVVNMVIGTGPSTGQHLVEHPDVPLVSFTGSTAVGKRIGEIGARLNKKISLEMGGKNAAIIYPSCDLGKHLQTIARSCFINQGEICLCSSRIFVHSSIYEDFVEKLVQEAKKYTVGNPTEDVTLGAMNSEVHFNKVKSYITLAEEEGGTVHCGGVLHMNGELKGGFFIAPTVVTDLPDSSRCMQEEIFGPVVCVTRFESLEEVTARANDTTYGLSATVWSENNEELINTAHRLRVGTVWCNTWLTRDLNMPFGEAALGPYSRGMRDADEASIACLELAKEGERFCREGNFSEAIPRFLDAIRLGTNNLSTLSAIYCQLGNAYYSTNDMDNAYVYHSYDAIVARLMHDKLGEAKAYGNMGNVMKMKDKFADALELTRKQLAIANELDDKQCLARAYYNLGTIYHARAKLAVKKSRNEYASRAGDAGDGNANADNDDLRAALECYMSSSKYSQSLEDHINVGRLFGCVGNVLYLLRDYRGAIECHEKRLMIASQFGDHIAKYRAYVNLGNAHVLLSEVDKGIECYTKHYHYCTQKQTSATLSYAKRLSASEKSALNLAIEKGDKVREAQCCFYIACSSSLLRHYSSAGTYHLRHLSLARSMSDSAGQARAYNSLATVYSNLGEYSKAAYFLACNRALAAEMRDDTMMNNAEDSLKKLIQENRRDLSIEGGYLQFDSSDDPEPQTHYCRVVEERDSTRIEFTDQPNASIALNIVPCPSTPSVNFRNPLMKSVGVEATESRRFHNQQEDFLDFLSRMQSARLDEQRCDVSALKLNPVVSMGRRQTDSLITTTTEEPDALIDLLLNAQSRRMDEQRAALLPGLNDQEQAQELLEKLESASSEGRGSRIDDALIDLLMRAQSQRMNEQRSELASDRNSSVESDPAAATTPEDDVSALVMRMQAGRFEEQRAHLNTQNENA
ncbi:hypothetical protein Y032_0095g2838 [Ancylostoma ceylanicum]|uniref:Aldehyde dehydrogenase domain-containing protein n=1 Tax=Ancylostoma ceylanicum TaxID=53326 RepID=A0A016TKR7_9BILA|nr:hypothetical protein Y032_0095g2838 [Ancylostoma ceylanicum]